MVQIRKMRQDDFEFAATLANTADWNMNNEDFQFEVALEPDGCLVATQGAERVGIATCISYGKLGWFGNLIVDQRHRSKGVGALLLNNALDRKSVV
jgi:GNAT superfamily N-acetyltransferase